MRVLHGLMLKTGRTSSMEWVLRVKCVCFMYHVECDSVKESGLLLLMWVHGVH